MLAAVTFVEAIFFFNFSQESLHNTLHNLNSLLLQEAKD